MDRLKRKLKDIRKLPNKFNKIAEDTYVYRFPVYRYNTRTLITCIFTIDTTENNLYIEVIDNDNRTIYAPYYNPDNNKNNIVVQQIEYVINVELHKLEKEGVI